ncbi:MAG: hypothetical protein ACTHK7_20550, partial [Aureliella sp.]
MQRKVRTVIARALTGLGLAFALSASFAGAQEPLAPQAQATAPNRWLVVLCGLPGDQLHRERMTQAARQIVAAAEPVLLVSKERVKVLAGDDEMAQAVSQSAGPVDVCTAESMEALFRSLGEQIAAEDACWVISIGHAQLFGNRSTFNVQGPDVDAERFARIVAPLKCGQRVFVLTMPLSGLWVKPLKGPESVCIAATEAGPELTATEMPYALADILAGKPAHQSLTDIDEDGAVTLLDLYLAVSLEVHQRYKALERLQLVAVLDIVVSPDADGCDRSAVVQPEVHFTAYCVALGCRP